MPMSSVPSQVPGALLVERLDGLQVGLIAQRDGHAKLLPLDAQDQLGDAGASSGWKGRMRSMVSPSGASPRAWVAAGPADWLRVWLRFGGGELGDRLATGLEPVLGVASALALAGLRGALGLGSGRARMRDQQQLGEPLAVVQPFIGLQVRRRRGREALGDPAQQRATLGVGFTNTWLSHSSATTLPSR